MIPKGIDDKYEVIRILQETAATAVLLVNYKKVGALRILKAIHKADSNANSILSEAHLLQGFKSSQIPTLYEVEETDEFFYLVEEFVEGISLREYLQKNKLERNQLLHISIELCKIVECLHTAGSEPVIYRDMKPEHVYLAGDDIKLIDFGIAILKSNAKNAKAMGTKGWAAPEQLKGEALDEGCDIYGLGKVIEFMQMNSYGKDDFRIKQIVEYATKENPKDRFSAVEEMRASLESLQGARVNDKIGKKHLERKIAVIGGGPSVGTTRIAMSLCRFFNRKKIDCYYRDIEKDTVLKLWKNLKNAKLRKGVLYHDSFQGILEYGETVEHYKAPDGLYIYDCGSSKEIPLGTDIILYVVGGAPWQQVDEYPAWITDENVYVINNFSDRVTAITLAREIKKKVYRYPTVQDSEFSWNEEKVFSAIFKNKKDLFIGQQQ
ncbi:serine/threonine protein kinase [Pseudobutyrivibrio sp. ACV-2]|uniref:serine/threonine protein kinase n=1 Tax=Pseudobutyrivibrio sp. ACV-2 TaxID=1520801 RepID=UPI00089BEAC6|nr:protein kinase [Pseudobutyrivibrio sp. ACV-2]SEA47235.1 serine/threonine protein kinase [Pseudobutyrivibrio sp. ACV-2]